MGASLLGNQELGKGAWVRGNEGGQDGNDAGNDNIQCQVNEEKHPSRERAATQPRGWQIERESERQLEIPCEYSLHVPSSVAQRAQKIRFHDYF